MRRGIITFAILLTMSGTAGQSSLRMAPPGELLLLKGSPDRDLRKAKPGVASLCGEHEKVIFSCAIKDSKKLLSLCGSEPLDKQRGYLQYRFGRPGKIELEFPQERQNTQSAFRYSRYTRPLVTYLVLRFETNEYLYSIHENYNAEEKPPGKEALITVSSQKALGTDPDPVGELHCRMPLKGTLMDLEGVVTNTDEEPLGDFSK